MIIDSSSRRNLELTETLREKQKRGSLLWVLDRTKTAMGARTLRAMVEQPLIDRAEIEKRHEAIAELNAHVITREELREYLNPIYDLERLIGRISYQTANPRDLIAFRTSLEMLPHIHTLLEDFHSPLLSELREEMDVLSDLRELIAEAIREDPPISIRDGDIITFDLRFKTPNTGDLLSNSEMHSAEHLIATLLRNSEDKEAVIYFGPMGCQTGFYFLFDNRLLSCEGAIELLKEVFDAAADFDGEMPGKSPAECGNYVNLDVETGRAVCRFYAELIRDWTVEKLAY